MTDTDRLAALPSYIDREWLDGEHPTFYDTEDGPIARCTTCQEWSPCRVRTLFEFAQGVRVGDDGLRAAAQAMLDKWGHHSGSCCTFDADGKVTVTEESCQCGPVERALRAALAASPAAAPVEPDPNRRGMPKCPRCGDIAYRPDPVSGRQQAWRCGGCHRTLGRCTCPASPAPTLDHPNDEYPFVAGVNVVEPKP